jgi:predicted small secreted protein
MKLKTLLLCLTFALAGCNTIAGLGEDVADGARTVQTWF